MKKRWICLFVENDIGVLARISGLFSGKSYNLNSLTVGRTEDETVSRMTVSLTSDDKVFEQVKKQFGGADILINNAGIAWFGLLTDITDNDWDKILATNLSSVFYCSRAAIPYMVSKKCGKILNISSMWGTVGASCEVAYSATKSGIHGLTRALAKELAPSNIQVNAIACGVIDTEMNGRLNEEERQDLMDEIPSGRFADPEEVAELALKLTDTPAYMTGQIIGIDGGFI